uniref:2-hydroxyacyl-CoA lyase 2 n=1 Tax=Syphacia muris TaxID=451379 RepID=A0A0N5ATZ0_9BILA
MCDADESSKRNGGELVASVLKAHNVKEIFALCGGHISAILVAAEKLGIRVVDTRSEANAVFAADAVARLRQTIGVAAVTAGPGVTNTITAVKNAQMAEIPLLLLGGAAPTMLKNCGALQDIDQISLFKPICKYVTSVKRIRDITETLRKAISVARSGTPGPVFVELPVDLLYPYAVIEKELGFISEPKNFMQRMTNFYLRYYISQLFSEAWIERDVTEILPSIPKPQPDQVEELAQLIMSAKRPLLLIGSQAVLPPVKPTDLQSSIMKMKLPTYLGGMARGLLGRNCKYQMRQNRRAALKKADLVVLAGMVCDFRLSYGRSLPAQGEVISINRNRTQMCKNKGVFWKAKLLIEADVGLTLQELSNALSAKGYSGCSTQWIDELTEQEVMKNAENERKAEEFTSGTGFNPIKVLSLFNKFLPDDAILVVDGGDFVGTAAYVVQPRGPLGWLDPGPFGTLGVGGGFAIGAKVVYPNRPVYIIYGDGACGYSVLEFDTFVRHNLPVGALIGNDACWSQIARDQVPLFNNDVGVMLSHSKYEKIAEAFGAKGNYIDKGSCSQLDKTIQEFTTTVANGTAMVANVIIGKSDFRAGSISV